MAVEEHEVDRVRQVGSQRDQRVPFTNLGELRQAGRSEIGARRDDLARQHLTSAFGGPRYDPALLDQLAGHEDVLPGDLGLRKLMAWAVERGIEAPEAFWRAFREEAIMLGLGRAIAAGGSVYFHARPADAPDSGSGE